MTDQLQPAGLDGEGRRQAMTADQKLVELALEFHREVEGEYGCPGVSCPGVQRLLRGFVALDGVGKASYREPVSVPAAPPPYAPPNEWTEQQIHRLIDQSQTISRMLAEAGVGSCTLVEGVREIINRVPAAPPPQEPEKG